ncbi:hypothetical protein PCAR4_340056 [Paraburkholderia caribensis]|nr:hypothetical protein PCAR4_340056 [Paraburkholderia caribensis]
MRERRLSDRLSLSVVNSNKRSRHEHPSHARPARRADRRHSHPDRAAPAQLHRRALSDHHWADRAVRRRRYGALLTRADTPVQEGPLARVHTGVRGAARRRLSAFQTDVMKRRAAPRGPLVAVRERIARVCFEAWPFWITRVASAVRQLIETPAPLQGQATDGIMTVGFAIALEAGAFDQKGRSGFHPVAREAERAEVEWKKRVIRQLTRGGKNRDAVRFRRVQHGLSSKTAPWLHAATPDAGGLRFIRTHV